MISFVGRVRDEAKTLGSALASFARVTVPHKILLTCDRCTDDSEGIARAAGAEVYRNDVPISRAGLETLVTQRWSRHSLPAFLSSAFERARSCWKFHIAGDFVLSDELVRFLNTELMGITGPTKIRLPAVSSDGTRNCECYLSNCLEGFDKYLFWEVPRFTMGARELTVDAPIWHVSSLADIKPYWNEPPWFESYYGDEARAIARKYRAVCAIVGAEGTGTARGSNPACDEMQFRVQRAEYALSGIGVSFTN